MRYLGRLRQHGAGDHLRLDLQSVKVHGVCSNHYMSHFAYSGGNELLPLVLPTTEEETVFNESKTDVSASRVVPDPFRDLNDLVLGGSGLSNFVCPFASVWTVRHGLFFRFRDGIFSRVFDFKVQDDKTRVVGTLALKFLPSTRANRAVIVLSDGSVFLLEL